ncbi:peptidoglycan DD-metalloendopeptidase family protein (plasmid) [Rhodococcus ruber]|uniref:peptidoglycan DD-metalloendopeptidase family protein n=1 Tax=Rhodococcus TaxID=1827 RepID=UPI0015668C03|nr:MULTISPECIES: peptidoglycan DD-metalloendopeptidase family protein [Rhodococcus]UQB75958.1 peptidoglycan DD-metalloendopeptidase family protein [Rhodococcus ruber]
MSVRRAGKALLLGGAAAVVIGTSACSVGAPVIPRDPCRVLPTDTSGSAETAPGASVPVSGPIQLPVRPGTTTHTSGFGPRWGGQHQGDDLAGPVGTPILAALDGVVVAAGSSGEGPGVGFENWVIIDSNVDGSPVSTVYGHMFADGIHVSPGQRVTAGEHIADIGNAGSSTGAHLHFEYWQGGRLQGGTPIDPVTVLPEIAQQNGGAALLADDPHTSDSERSSDVQLVAASRSTADCSGFGMAGGGNLAFGAVPAEFEPWLRRAGAVCPEIDSALLAAQLQQENNFRHGPNAPVSPAGAVGPAQFMPGTWATWGKDHDGDGTADPNSIGDAVISQAHFMCALYQDISEVPGDPIELTLAAYNAGPGAVLLHRGIPPYAETQNYVAKITAARAAFTNPNSRGRFMPNASDGNGQVVAAAREYLGTPYVWGGGGIGGPSGGGFDCSGLTSFAVHAASAGKISLPRTSEQQWTVGVEVPIEKAQPGDLVFGSWGPAGPGHVGIYSGNGQMVHAPTTGDVVTEAPLQPGMKARRVM